MSAVLDYLNLCRLCLVKDKVNIAIFDETSDVRQLFLKISACLPVKVAQDDRLPKKICDSCLYKVDLLYQFWNTTISSEKQLLQWCNSAGEGVKGADDTLMLPQSHAHPHSIHTETIILKEERPDSADTKLVDGYGPELSTPTATVSASDLYSEEFALSYQQQQLPEVTDNYTQNQPQKKRPRGRPPGSTKKKRQSTRSRARRESVEDSEDDRPLAAAISDPEDSAAGLQITKEEAESDEDYVDNTESLEPTTFVAVPSTSVCELPGPSGVVTKGSTTTTTTSSGSASTEQGETVAAATPTATAAEWPYNFVTVNVAKNASTVDLRRYVCMVCDASFDKYLNLRTHRRTHLSKSVACPQCDRQFKTQWEVNNHQRYQHRAAHLYYKCTLCDKQYPQASALQEHQRRHRRDFKVFCDQCGQGFFSRAELIRHAHFLHDGQRHICFPCDKAYKDAHTLAQHMQQKHDPTYVPAVYTCTTCNKTFTNPYYFRQHERRHTSAEKPDAFVCDLCGKVVSSAMSLRDHTNRHTGERPHTCTTCGKGFTSAGQLKTHVRTHTGERPYACTTCDKRFTQRSTLVIHMRTHTGERPYPCTICRKEFASRNLMKMHSKVHGTALADI